MIAPDSVTAPAACAPSARAGWLAALTIAAAGMLVALYHADSRALHHDEAASLRKSQYSWDQLVHPRQFEDAPTLPNQAGPSANTTSELLNRWLFIAGFKVWTDAFGSSPLAMRGFSIGFHGLFVLAFYALLLELLRESSTRTVPRPRIVALIALALGTLNALALHQAGQVRNYSLCTTLLMLTAWAILRAARRGRWTDWALVAVFGIAAFYSFNVAMMTLAGLWTWFGLRRLFRAPARAESPVARTSHAPWIAAAGTTVLALLPAVLHLASQRGSHGAAGWWMPVLTWSRFFEFAPGFVFGDSLFLHNSPATGVAILAAFALALYRTWRIGFLLPVVAGLLPFLALVAASLTGPNVVIPRYFLVLSPFLYTCMAIALCTIPSHRLQLAAVAGVIAVVLAFSVRSVTTWDRQSAGGSREIAAWIQRNVEPGATVIVSPWLYLAVRYYFPPEADVRVYVRADTGIPFYMSGPLLDRRDRVTSLSDLIGDPPKARHAAYVHVGINEPPIDPVALPEGWTVEQRKRFESPFVISEVVVVRTH
ncbi:MAG TPA: hypothetical protein VF516_14945 [Kofleriaceae bacterium]